MVIPFASNQVLVTTTGTGVTITTDPVSMKGNDRVTAMLLVHSIWHTGTLGTATLTYKTQVSNDGVHWADDGPSDSATAASSTPVQAIAETLGAFMRMEFELTLPSGEAGDICAVAFDLHALLDHS